MPLPKEAHYTLADALTWADDDRIELINGSPVMMAPPSRAHQKIVSELNRQLGNYLQGRKCEVYPAPFAVRLFEEKGDSPENVDSITNNAPTASYGWRVLAFEGVVQCQKKKLRSRKR